MTNCFSRIGAALLAALLAWAPTSASAQANGRFVEIAAAPSRVIAAPHVTVWLPPYYDQRSQRHRRYGVLYMNDGQNVFFPVRSGFNKVWGADRAVLRLMRDHAIDPVIVVAVDHPGDARYRQYFPQALYAKASPGLRAKIDAMAKGPLTGDAYVRFLTKELKPSIDRQFRTRRDAQHTAIVGSSMGGLISCYAFVQRPWIFGRAACVSTHWPLVEPGAIDPEVAGLWDAYFKHNLGRAGHRRLWMDHGTETLDAAYGPWQDTINADLTRRGWIKGDDFESRTFPGAAHEENAWAARLGVILAWLMRPKT